MRKIKFRSKSIAPYEEWVYGCLVTLHDEPTDTDLCYIYQGNSRTKVYPETAGQYTGLKDKNGKEIFEGDIIRVCGNKNGAFVVQFKNQYVGGWILKYKDENDLSLGARKENDVEIIGNIHESL